MTFYGSEKEYHNPEFLSRSPIGVDTPATSINLVKGSDPYFVVTKLSVKMTAYSDIDVSLNVCPLVEGNLKVLGFRFKLLNEVWVYHRFDLPGPLLQDTQMNKARRGKSSCTHN
jgi:hypothetical protein